MRGRRVVRGMRAGVGILLVATEGCVVTVVLLSFACPQRSVNMITDYHYRERNGDSNPLMIQKQLIALYIQKHNNVIPIFLLNKQVVRYKLDIWYTEV